MTATIEKPSAPAERPALSARERRRSELTRMDRVIRVALLVAGILPAFALVMLAFEMVKEAWPAFSANGWHFFASTQFSAGNNGYGKAQKATFGVNALLFGTVVSSLIALVLAVPVSVGGALLLVEKAPARIQNLLGVFLELLAGIPSVVYGLWGYFTLGPFFSHNVFQWIADLHIPWLDGSPQARGLLSASIVLSVMIIPIIAATTRELIRSVPAVSKEGAVALGLTSAETVRFVTLPFIRTGVIAAAILGWGRALGETIAVLIISNNQVVIPKHIYDPFFTMAAEIASDLDTALTDPTSLHALAEVGLVLLFVTMLTNFGGRLLARRFGGGVSLPVGAGL